MQLGGMESVSVTTAGFDNLCGLYLTVLEDLWNTDSGLNSDITELGIDLSQTRLSQSEQAAVAWAFGQYTGLSPIQGTFEELAEPGYLTQRAARRQSGRSPVLAMGGRMPLLHPGNGRAGGLQPPRHGDRNRLYAVQRGAV